MNDNLLVRVTNVVLGLLVALMIGSCGGGGREDSAGAPVPQADATLNTLSLSAGELDQPFAPAQQSYTASVSYLASSIGISAAATDTSASITVNGMGLAAGETAAVSLVEGSNSIDVEVSNGSSTQSYLLTVTRASHDDFVQSARLKAGDPEREAVLGTSLAASGNTLVAGSPQHATKGAAYVFARDDSGLWVQKASLVASNADAGDAFGVSVGIYGDTVVVGAPGESSEATSVDGDQADNSSAGSGAAYVFARDTAGQWTQQAYLKASDGGIFEGFGTTVAIEGDTIAVSARRTEIGTIYIFKRDAAGLWHQESAFEPGDHAADIGFADSLAIDGDTIAVGAKWHRGVPDGEGAVYVFKRAESGVWSQQTLLKASNAGAGDDFGGSVSLSGDTLLVGAVQEASASHAVNGEQNDDSASGSGAAYVFSRDASGAWHQEAYLKASNSEADDNFGYSVAVAGDWLAVGADDEGSGASGTDGDQSNNDAAGSGAVYLYKRAVDGTWSQQMYIKASDSASAQRFGRKVVFTDRGLAVASPFGNGRDATEAHSGTLYVFD